MRRNSHSKTSRAACRASTRTKARSATSVLLSTADAESRRWSTAIRRVRLRCLRPRSAMIRLPMWNVDSWFLAFVTAMNGRHRVRLRTRCCRTRARKVCSAQRSRGITASAIESICPNQDAVGTKPSSVIPKRSTSGDVEESEMFRTYASSRLLSTTMRTSAIAYLPTRAERRRGQRPQAVRNARSKRSGEL